jgi:hypothetical protein
MRLSLTWVRAPEHDKRLGRGDDRTADAWRHTSTGEIGWIEIGFNLDGSKRYPPMLCRSASSPSPHLDQMRRAEREIG